MEISSKNRVKYHFQRFEFKYQIPQRLIHGIIPMLLKYMDIDDYAKFSPEKYYEISSLYFDTPTLLCYHDKLDGVRTRKKLRIRKYISKIQDDTPVFLEIKKRYDTVMVKDRVKLTHKECRDLFQNNYAVKTQIPDEHRKALNDFLWLKIRNGMVAQNMVIYKRIPFMGKYDPRFRVTIDYDIRTHSAQWIDEVKRGEAVYQGMAILEVKFNNILPFWFLNIIRKYGLEKAPFSKYCNSLEVCHPRLNPQSASSIHLAPTYAQVNSII